MSAERTTPPDTLPSAEEQWLWTRLAYTHAYKLKEDVLPKMEHRLAKVEVEHDGQWTDQYRTNNAMVEEVKDMQKRVTTLENSESRRAGKNTILTILAMALMTILQSVVIAMIVKNAVGP